MAERRSWFARIKQHGVPGGLKIIGSGPFPLLGEARRQRRAIAYARRIVEGRHG